MNLQYKERGFEQVEDYLTTLPYGVKRVALWAIASYLIGDDSHGYRHYPPLKNQAYLQHVPPSYVRTNATKNSWSIGGPEYQPKIISKGVPYVQYVPRWSKYGWREWSQVAFDNMTGAIRHANAKIKEYLSRK